MSELMSRASTYVPSLNNISKAQLIPGLDGWTMQPSNVQGFPMKAHKEHETPDEVVEM